MAPKSGLLTSREFSSRTGLPAATVSRLIRDGNIKAVKKSGKWMIEADQLEAEAVLKASKKSKPAAKKKPKKQAPKKDPKPATASRSYSVAEFAAMTYLTEKGVLDWLKTGRLSGRQDAGGAWRVDSGNLEVPDVKRLLR